MVLSFCLVSGWFILLANEYQLLGKHIASGSVYISNFILESESGYFDIDAPLKPLLHLWSLSIEEQFYLIFPLLLITVFRFNLNPIWMILFFLILSFALNDFYIENNPSKVFYYPQTRAWELLIGSSVAYINLSIRQDFDTLSQHLLLNRIIDKEKAVANLFSWFGFTLIMIAWLSFDHEQIHFPGNWALMPSIGAGCLILAGEKAWLNRSVFANKITVFIGLISYPLYLWHWPLLSFTRIVQMEHPSFKLRFVVLLVSGVLAWLTYRLVEKNLRYREHWAIAVGLFACLAVIGGLGYQVKLQKGYPERFHYSNQFANSIGLEPWKAQGWLAQKACTNRFGEYLFCLLQNNSQPITAMLMGDSHANHLYPGLLQNISFTGGNLLNLGMGACLHFLNQHDGVVINEGKHCQSFIDKALEIAISTPSVKTVILGGAWSGSLKQKKTLRKFWDKTSKNLLGVETKDTIRNFQDSMRETLQALLNARKEVVFVMDIPGLGFEPSNCTERPWRISGELVKNPCVSASSVVKSKAQQYDQLVEQVLAEFPQVKVWHPSAAFCDKTYCWAVKEGKMLYRDENHLNEAGSLYLGKHFQLQ